MSDLGATTSTAHPTSDPTPTRSSARAPGATDRRPGPLLSKTALCLVYTVFAAAHLRALGTDGFRLSVALLLAFETAMIGLVLTRRDASLTDLSPTAVAAGLLGSFAVLALRPVAGHHDVLVGQALQLAGAVLQLGAAASMGRSFGLVPANRGVRVGGLYRLVRHPFYLAYLVAQLGYLVNNPSVANLVVVTVATGFQVVRIDREERLLLGDPTYRAYAAGTRWHLVPGLW